MPPSDRKLKLPALDPAVIAPCSQPPDYPLAFQDLVEGIERRRLGDAAGLRNFGVNLLLLQPGRGSSQRHWHTKQDEFVFVLQGEVVLVSDAGEQLLTPGMAAGFPAGKPDGHHLINRGDRNAILLEIGDRSPGDEGDYPDIDMKWINIDGDQLTAYVHKNGTPY